MSVGRMRLDTGAVSLTGHHSRSLITDELSQELQALVMCDGDREGGGADPSVTAAFGAFADTLWIQAPNGNEIYIRHADDTVTVKMVMFSRTRCGVFSKAVALIVAAAEQVGVTRFVVESVITPDMRDWCIKHRMTPNGHGSDIQIDGLCVDYETSVELLSKLL